MIIFVSQNIQKMIKHKRTCFVAMLDIMGFKDLVKQDSETTYKLLKKAYIEAKRQAKYKTLDISIFSDTIIIVSHNDNKESFEDIIISSAHFIKLFLNEGFAINGAITYGDVVYDKSKNVCFGIPVSAAHLLQEDLFCYGIIVDDSVITRIEDFNENIYSTYLNLMSSDIIIKIKVPFKSKGWVSMSFINWLKIEQHSLSYEQQITIAKKQLTKLCKNLPSQGRANMYFVNTENCLKQWYDFTGMKNSNLGWGNTITNKYILNTCE